LHHATAEYDDLRIICVNQRDRVNRPYIQTMLAYGECDGIFLAGRNEERLQINLCCACQHRFVESRCLSCYPRQ
jgi:coenzyme F420-reducing hydrogenase delta subunit